MEPILNQNTFKNISNLFYQLTGIELKDHKKYLVENRLSKYIGEGKEFSSFEDFYQKLLKDKTGDLKKLFIQSLITNYTFFFREPIHFSFVRWYLRNRLEKELYIRIWSNGCSTGEEAYSIAISSLMEFPNIENYDFKILASDVVKEYLIKAQEGIYSKSKLSNLNYQFLLKFFDYLPNIDSYRIKEKVKKLIAFRILNLISTYPFTKEFDIVFLRNVLIYFNKKEKEEIINKIYQYIKKNGYLIIGLSESLVGIDHPLKMLKHSIYKKI